MDQLAPDSTAPTNPDYLAWLKKHSMHEEVKAIASRFSGRGRQWAYPYARPHPRAATERASVWFTAYPASVITAEGALSRPDAFARQLQHILAVRQQYRIHQALQLSPPR
jgi:hypothetical protein